MDLNNPFKWISAYALFEYQQKPSVHQVRAFYKKKACKVKLMSRFLDSKSHLQYYFK